MLKMIVAIALGLVLSACANADGSMPRLGPAGSNGTGAAGYNGGYAGTNGAFSNLNTTSAPF